MKVSLCTTWFPQHCGMAYYSRFLSDALKKYVDVEICVVEPSFTLDQWVKAAESCTGSIVHLEHEWGIFHGFADVFLDVLRRSGKRSVITVHGGDCAHFFGRADQVCLTSRWQNPYGLPVLPHGVTVYPRYNTMEARNELGIDREKVVLMWGFVLPHKQYETTLDAVKDRGDACFLIAGSEERNVAYWDSLQPKMKGAKCQVVKTGFLGELDVSTVFSAADLCVLPYSESVDSGCLRYALGSGVLVLASPIPFFSEVQLEYGVPLLSGNMVADINTLLDNPYVEGYTEKCKRFAEANSWENIAKKHVQVYEKVLEKKQ